MKKENKKINLMHKLFGEVPDRKCKDCQHLVSYTANRKYYKCEFYGETSSEASDWRLKYTACGLIDIPVYTGVPVIKMSRFYQPKEDIQIDGQLVFDEFVGIKIPDGMWEKPDRKNVISVKMKACEFVLEE